MDAGRNAQIIKVKQVLVDGNEFAIAETRHGISLDASQDQSTHRVHTVDNQTLFINPIQDEGLIVQVLAALAPSRTATLLDDAIAEHVQDIAEGAVASIMRLTQQEFTNMADSSVHETIFRERIKTIGAKTGRGLMAAKITRKPRFI